MEHCGDKCVLLRVEDIEHKSLTIKVRVETAESGKERLVVLSPITYQKLHQYLTRERSGLIEDYGGEEGGFIFLSEIHRNPGQPISVWTVQDVIKKVRKLVGAPGLTPHKLRHLMLNDLVRGGMELSEVSYYAGHASLATTNLYVHPKRSIVARHVRKATKWRDDQMRRLIEETKPHE